MINPSGLSGACSITVPTPNVRRRLIGDEARCVVLYASKPVIDPKSLVMKALRNLPLATSFTTSKFLARLEFVSFSATSSEGKVPCRQRYWLMKSVLPRGVLTDPIRKASLFPTCRATVWPPPASWTERSCGELCRRSRQELRCFEVLAQSVPQSIYSYVLRQDARPPGDDPNEKLGRHILYGYRAPWRRLASAKCIPQCQGLPAGAD